MKTIRVHLAIVASVLSLVVGMIVGATVTELRPPSNEVVEDDPDWACSPMCGQSERQYNMSRIAACDAWLAIQTGESGMTDLVLAAYENCIHWERPS